MDVVFYFLAIELDAIPKPREKPDRKTETLPITDGFRNAVPRISFQRNPMGVALSWSTRSPAMAESVENYQIMVDNQPYGKLIAPRADTKYQVNLPPGDHECYLEVIPKYKEEEVYKSNVLKINIPPASVSKHDQRQLKEPSDAPLHEVLEQKDLPILKLNIQTVNPSSVRATWYLDRPMPADVFVASYEVHARGQYFPDQLTSDANSQQDGYTEHLWHVSNSPLEITNLSERHDYTIFVRAFFHLEGSKDMNYMKTTSNEVTTARVDPLIELLPRPLLKVTRVGVQMASLEWKLDDSADQQLVKGYRIILNSKPTEILPANQHQYELTGLKPGTENEVQVSVTTHPDFVDEKISEPIRIVCPLRPKPPVIQAVRADKPFAIAIKWKLDTNDQEEISAYKIFLDGKLHGEIQSNGRQSFKYDFNKLRAEQTHSVYIKSMIGQKKLHGYVYQCDVESNVSNELSLKCATPPKGTMPRLERMHPNGIEISWDAPDEFGDVKLTGYQILKDDRASGKLLSIDKRRVTIRDLDPGNRYAFRILPITDQPGGTLIRAGEEYNSDRHGHYLPGPKLEVEYTDLLRLPSKFWMENVAGHSALVCWSPIDESSPSNTRPDDYKLSIWNDKDITRDKPMIVSFTSDKTSAQLKDLLSGTTYHVQLELNKKRTHQTSKDQHIVSATSEILSFGTGSPPDAPTNLHLIACTNTDARIGFDPFIEHRAEVITIRVQCEAISSEGNAKDITLDITPDSTEFVLSNLIEHTEYRVTIYGITGEYLDENHCRDVGQLPKKLKTSDWLPNKTFEFITSGCEPVSQLNIRKATTELIELDWILPKVYGSTQYIGQALRWKLEHGNEGKCELNRNATSAIIPGPLPSGLYKVSLNSQFSVKISLEEDDDESRKDICLTTTETVMVRFHVPGTCESPEIYLTGYTSSTIDLAWNKPDLFSIIDHPEKNNAQLKIHRRLRGYRVNINGRKHDTLDEDQYRCTLTGCQAGEKYEVQLIARTSVQNEYIDEMITNDREEIEEPDETPSKKLRLRMLKKQDLLSSFQANFEFNHNENKETALEQRKEIQPIGKLNLNWTVADTKNISHFILQWHSSKDLRVQQKTVASNETSTTIDSCDEKHYYVIGLIIVTNDGERHEFEQLTIPIPGEPDAPKLWLVKTTNTSFVVEWSEPKSYGIPVIGFQLFIAGKKAFDMIEVNARRAEIPSRINRTYQMNICAITNNIQRPRSSMSPTLSVITTPTTNLVPTMYYNNDDGGSTSFDRSVARIIPLQIETVNEEKLHLDWMSFLPTAAIRAYYVHYTCLNNGDVQTMKVSKRFRHTVLRGLRPGFTYGIMIMAVDKNGGVLYTSDKSTVQMNAPPNAPIVNIIERENTHVKLEWRPAASYGEITVVGYKIFVNNRLAAVLRHDQLSYTLTNGIPCEIYTVHVQALSNEKTITSPMSRGVPFAWPGVKPGAFKRVDDGQIGNIIVAWEHPQLEDEKEKLVEYRIISENLVTHAQRLHGTYDAATQQATIHDLTNGKYRLWLEIKTENHCVRARPLIIMIGRFNSLLFRQPSLDSGRCFDQKQKRLRSPAPTLVTPGLRHVQYS